MTRTSPHHGPYDKDSYATNLPESLIEESHTSLDAFT